MRHDHRGRAAGRGAAAVALAAVTALGCAGGAEGPDVAAAPAAPTTSEVTTTAAATTSPTAAGADTEVTATPAPTTPAPTTVAPTTVAPTTAPPDPPPPVAALAGLDVRLEPFLEVEAPTALAWRSGDAGLYVAVQTGQILRVEEGRTTLVLDLSAETTIVEPGSERGLLGLAFDPRDGRMYVDFTGRDNHTRVVSFALADGVADPASRREVLFVEQPGVGHNGGHLLFDDAGHLYIGMGDGGGSNGRDAQDPTKLLGAILRVRPRIDGDGYDIPADNPFATNGADRPEVWVRGLRNPWMFSLDRPTGDLWIGDVGNSEREEVNRAPGGQSGLNFGWYYFEGTIQRYGSVPEGMTPPVLDYPRDEGVAVMGGYVYRGSAIAALRGAYVFGDLTGPVWALGSDGRARLDVERVNAMTGWGEDADGELYVFSLYDGVFRLVPG